MTEKSKALDTCPPEIAYETADGIAECYNGITEGTYRELWGSTNRASAAGTAQPMGGDGTNGTVETPCVGGYSNEMEAVWPTLTEAAKQNIIAVVRDSSWHPHPSDTDSNWSPPQ